MAIKVGERYGMLTVLELGPSERNPKAICRCDCGKITTPARANLRNGHTSSCGCISKVPLEERLHTHRSPKTKAYMRWNSMLQRCGNPKSACYASYGGRGISVEWKSFEEFYADMGDCPPGYWLERIDNNGNYSKANCEWATLQKNSLNKRTSRWWVANGVTYASSAEAGRALGMVPSHIRQWCNGVFRDGKFWPPKPGWFSYPKYEPVPKDPDQ